MRTVDCRCAALRADGSLYPLEKHPFIPRDADQARDIFEIQVAGLRQRLQTIHAKPVVGLSGGLDSALAVLVAHAAVDDPKDVHALVMPGFGTTERTYNNALQLANALGATVKVVDIIPAVRQHFAHLH